MSKRIAVVGAYGSGKTTLSTALSHLTGLPRTHGSPMREPIGGEGHSVHNWTDGQLMQLTVNRYAERLLGEAAHPEGFVSDGSVVHEWTYAKLRLVAGSYPGTDVPLDDRHRSTGTAVLEAAVDDIGLLMKHHARTAYDAFVHVPVEFELAPDNRPINENFRRLSDALLLPALAATGVPVHTVTGDLADRLKQAVGHLGLAETAVMDVEEAVRLTTAPDSK
ncbi:AAA family ATPase [Streptomyces daliensis]|uniref:AAA family ATPase n=1 Tax=Streptomyces daliensis TaxID=299421 RepID=A0A8T4IK28_9ACTN|nr:AAA family ATPase [Streptomyces daliensis]